MFDETKATYHRITHTCNDPDCHVPGFIQTLIEQEAIDQQRLLSQHEDTPIADSIETKPTLTIVKD